MNRTAGTTTLALAMAERFAAGGSTVVVVDGDVRDPRITALFNASSQVGFAGVVEHNSSRDQQGNTFLTRTMDPSIHVLGLGKNRGTANLKKSTVGRVIAVLGNEVDVVVVDGGPLLDLSSAIQFVDEADAVVLAMRNQRLRQDHMRSVARHIRDADSRLLPVLTQPSRRPARGSSVGADGSIG